MGYRNEVVLVVKNTVEVPADLVVLNECDTKGKGPGYIYFYWSWTKWDESFKVHQWMVSLDRKDYLFIRVGEEDEDIEELGGFYESGFTTGIKFPEQPTIRQRVVKAYKRLVRSIKSFLGV
jgi:hypothetical protein